MAHDRAEQPRSRYLSFSRSRGTTTVTRSFLFVCSRAAARFGYETVRSQRAKMVTYMPNFLVRVRTLSVTKRTLVRTATAIPVVSQPKHGHHCFSFLSTMIIASSNIQCQLWYIFLSFRFFHFPSHQTPKAIH